MTKNQKMFLGIAVLATAGYLIYKQNEKKPFANAGGRLAGRFAPGTIGGIFDTSMAPKAQCKCSPNANIASYEVSTGKPMYECCGNGIYAYAPGPVVTCKPEGCPTAAQN